MNETKPKKMINRNVAISLGIICFLLIAFIAYFTVTGISAQNSYSNLKNQNNQLQTWLDGNKTLLNQTQANNTSLENQIDSLNYNITNIQGKVNNLTDILNLNQSTNLYNGTLTIFADTLEMTTLEESIPYAGYATVQVSSSGIGQNVIIIVVWDYLPTLRYQSQFDLGSNGTAIFPVMPTSMFVYFSTQNSTETTNVTITYYY